MKRMLSSMKTGFVPTSGKIRDTEEYIVFLMVLTSTSEVTPNLTKFNGTA